MNPQQRPEEQPWPKPAYAWYVVSILSLAYVVAYVDRQILTLMIEPIRRDLQISDTEVSLLGGLAFAILYTFAAIPIGWLADSKSRRLIIAVGITTWSLMTAACGASKSFGQLFMARVGVGLGEATLAPSGLSMITDYFPPHRLGRAIAVFVSGSAFGGGVALAVGGAVIALVASLPPIDLPLVGILRPWQLAFFAVSLPGLVVVALMATVKEPLRRGRTRGQGDGQTETTSTVPLREAVSFFTGHWKTYVPVLSGFAALMLVVTAIAVWTPTLFIRTWGWSASEIGYFYGLTMMVGGPAGTIAGGWIADKLREKGHLDGGLRVCIGVAVLATPIVALMPLMPSAALSFLLLAPVTALLFAIGGLVPTALQLVTPNEFRAQAAALSLFFANLFGAAVGPTAVALLTDYVFHDDLALRYSLSIVTGVVAPLAALVFWAGLKPYRADMLAAARAE